MKQAGHKKSKKQREVMFSAWCEKQNVNFVAKKCRVHAATVRRYREIDNWDARMQAIAAKTAEKTAEIMSGRDAKYIEVAQETIDAFADSLLGHTTQDCPHCGQAVQVRVPKPRISASDFVAMVTLINRLRREQMGQYTERKLVVKYVYPEGWKEENERH